MVSGTLMDSLDRDEPASLPIDGILVINPRDFVDRRTSIERQLQPLGLAYEFIHSYDVADLDAAITARYFKDELLSPGQRSCALKHLQALRLVVERQWQRALILEDDALLATQFVPRLQAALQESSSIASPHVLFIGSGGNLYTPRRLKVPGRHLYKSTRGRLGEAYVLGSHEARQRIEWIEAHGIPLPIDNLFEQIDRECGIDLYWLEPPIVEQGSKNGRFQSVLEPAPPKIVRRITAALQKIRRKYLY
ncbi:MAG: glycosyltransferase family 25 protein [Nitrospira sp.]|nr:glycosyltransferase family 25 protein [Nitrospira sp.]